jgi:Transposase, Mutator family
MPIRRLRRRCRDGPGHGCARAVTDGIIRGFGAEVPEGIPGAGPGAGSVCACCREARLAQAGATYGAKFPKAAAKVTGDLDQLPAFYDYPAGHWVHLRTTNPIEPAFATVRHRTKITTGPGSPAAGLAMAFKLTESAHDHWRTVNAPHMVALVRAGATFTGGKPAGRPGEQAQPEAA